MTRVTLPGGKYTLDGLFMQRFDYVDSAVRDAQLEALYRDKGLMLQAAMGFVVVFMNFVHSPEFWIQGISDHGIVVSNN